MADTPECRVCRSAEDLVGLEALDLVLVAGTHTPVAAYLAERLVAILAPAPVTAAHAVTAAGRGRRGGPPA